MDPDEPLVVLVVVPRVAVVPLVVLVLVLVLVLVMVAVVVPGPDSAVVPLPVAPPAVPELELPRLELVPAGPPAAPEEEEPEVDALVVGPLPPEDELAPPGEPEQAASSATGTRATQSPQVSLEHPVLASLRVRGDGFMFGSLPTDSDELTVVSLPGFI